MTIQRTVSHVVGYVNSSGDLIEVIAVAFSEEQARGCAELFKGQAVKVRSTLSSLMPRNGDRLTVVVEGGELVAIAPKRPKR